MKRPYRFLMPAGKVIGSPLTAGIDLTDTDIRFYYELEDISGNVAVDSGPNGNDGTLPAGAGTRDPAFIGKGIFTLAGNFHRIDSNQTSLNDGFTIMGWFRRDAGWVNITFWGDLNSGGDDESARCYLGTDSGFFHIKYGDGTSSFVDKTTYATAIHDEVFMHIAMTNNNGTIKIYEDGALVHTVATGITPGGTAGADVFIAASGANNALRFSGDIDQVIYYDKVLSDSQIQDIYDAQVEEVDDYHDEILASSPDIYLRMNELSGTTLVDEVGSNDGTITGSVVSYNVRSRVGDPTATSIQTNLTFIDVPSTDMAIEGDWTMEIVARRDGGSLQRCIFSMGNSSNEFVLSAVVTAGQGWLGFTSKTISICTTPLGSFGFGVDHHVALVKDGSTARIYIDGVEEASGSFNPPNDPSTNGEPFKIGFRVFHNDFNWKDYLDEFAYYNRALPASELLDHANAMKAIAP